jgi:hypothetical protein
MQAIFFYPPRFDFLSKNYCMKTKTLLFVLFGLISTFGAYAQTSDAEADALINLLGVQKREAIAKLVPVSGKDSVAFWKVYNEYQQANKANAKSRIKLYEETAHSYGNMTPVAADSLAKRYFVNRMEQEKMLETYFNKIKTATNPIVAFEFYQAEVYLLTQIRSQIMSQIPTYSQVMGPRK